MRLPRELKIGDLDLIRVTRRMVKEAGEDDVAGGAAELAYRLFLAIFPFFVFIAALGGFLADLLGVTDPTEQIMGVVEGSLPPDTASVLRRELDRVITSRDLGLVSVGIIAAIWAASGGVGTIAKVMNRIYRVQETRKRPYRYALAVGLTLLGGASLIGGFMIMILGQIYGLELARELGIEGAAARAFTLARWPVAMVAALVSLAVLYWAAPNVSLPFRWVTPGAVGASAGWLVTTYAFGLYVASFGSYNAIYGTLAGVVILLVWLYISGLVLLLGAEINAVLLEEATPDQPQDPKA